MDKFVNPHLGSLHWLCTRTMPAAWSPVGASAVAAVIRPSRCRLWMASCSARAQRRVHGGPAQLGGGTPARRGRAAGGQSLAPARARPGRGARGPRGRRAPGARRRPAAGGATVAGSRQDGRLGRNGSTGRRRVGAGGNRETSRWRGAAPVWMT